MRRMNPIAILIVINGIGLLAIVVGAFLFVNAIQQNRKDVTRANCVDQNRRHNKTISTLDHRLDPLLAKAPSGLPKLQLQGQKQFTVDLINDLAPFQNCTKKVNRLYH